MIHSPPLQGQPEPHQAGISHSASTFDRTDSLGLDHYSEWFFFYFELLNVSAIKH